MRRFWKGRRNEMTSPAITPDPRLDKVEYARQLLAETREEVARADAKASLLFSAFGVVISAVSAVLIADDWSPFQLNNRVEWLWWAGASLSGIALFLLGWAVLPRVTHVDHRDRLYYFGHVAEYGKDFDGFAKRFESASDEMWHRTVDQIWAVSKIAKRKYLLTRRSMLTFLAAGSALGGAAVGDLFVR